MAHIETRSVAPTLCRLGDISITPTSTGYEIRRFSADGVPAGGWELVTTVASARAAGRSARELAARAGRSIWLCFGGADLIPMPPASGDTEA